MMMIRLKIFQTRKFFLYQKEIHACKEMDKSTTRTKRKIWKQDGEWLNQSKTVTNVISNFSITVVHRKKHFNRSKPVM